MQWFRLWSYFIHGMRRITGGPPKSSSKNINAKNSKVVEVDFSAEAPLAVAA